MDNLSQIVTAWQEQLNGVVSEMLKTAIERDYTIQVMLQRRSNGDITLPKITIYTEGNGRPKR